MELLKETLESITGAYEDSLKEARNTWDGLFKLKGGLGSLEEMSIKISGMTGQVENDLNKKGVVVFCADNDIVEEGVSLCPQSLTADLVLSTLKGTSAISVLSRWAKADTFVVDMGMKYDVEHEDLINKKVMRGTKNFINQPAMTKGELIKAIEIGIELGDDLFLNQGYKVLGSGELGMGNTTTSAALFAVLSGLPVRKTCGKGSGLTDEQYENKVATIEKAIENNNPDREDIIDVMSKVGGLDIAGICGLYLSAAKNRRPVVIDGFISSVAALCAIKFDENVKDFLLPSHLSKEPGAKYLMKEIGLKPILDMDMRLGEGVGCPLTFKILDSSQYTLKNMGTFEEWNIDTSMLVDMEGKKY